MYKYKGKIERVIDGDTIIADIDLGFEVHKKERLMLARINAPEVGTDEGKKAKEFMKQFEGQEISITTSKLDKYGRYVAEITLIKDQKEVNLSDIILENNLATYVKF